MASDNRSCLGQTMPDCAAIRPKDKASPIAENAEAGGRIQNWIAHVVTFITEVRPEVVLPFARRHTIPIRDLAAAYQSMKSATGETNPALESTLERLASVT
ncbi:MAG: hypothetical protein JOY83_24585 [Alphaproteobacteria bacterium]|nr:hypothetical protein [Alphaproteobacteria bacterium]